MIQKFGDKTLQLCNDLKILQNFDQTAAKNRNNRLPCFVIKGKIGKRAIISRILFCAPLRACYA